MLINCIGYLIELCSKVSDGNHAGIISLYYVMEEKCFKRVSTFLRSFFASSRTSRVRTVYMNQLDVAGVTDRSNTGHGRLFPNDALSCLSRWFFHDIKRRFRLVAVSGLISPPEINATQMSRYTRDRDSDCNDFHAGRSLDNFLFPLEMVDCCCCCCF